MDTVKLNKYPKNGYTYATPKRDFYIKKEGNKFILFDYIDFEIDSFKTLKETKERILLTKNNPYTPLNYSSDINSYIELCHKNLIHCNLTNTKQIAKDYINKQIEYANKFTKIANKENFIISKSPYSNSFYAHEKSDTIDWGNKPEGSYRMSDHWNFGDNQEHCKTVDGIDYDLAICKIIDGLYNQV